MTVYYVSAAGSDSAAGTSTGTAWATLSKVNTECAGGTIGLGDSVLFRAGDTFYGALAPPAGLSPASGALVTFGAYGVDDRPTLSAYKILNTSAGWSTHDSTTQKIVLTTSSTHTGLAGAATANVGFLKVDGVIYGQRRWALIDLADPWDFYCDATTLYVRATANPTTLAADIRAAAAVLLVDVQDATALDGLRFTGAGGHATQAVGRTLVRVHDCEFAEIGGGQLSGTIRYGNGFEAWTGGADIRVGFCTFRDIYDVALTCQGTDGTWSDIAWFDNTIYRCTQAFEFWTSGTTGGLSNVVVEDNVSLFAGYGWAGPVRDNQYLRAHLITYEWALPADIQVRRNVFWDAAEAYRYDDSSEYGLPAPGLVCSQNYIAQRPGALIDDWRGETIEQSAAYIAAVGQDVDSTFVVLPASADTDISDGDVAAVLDTVRGWFAGTYPAAYSGNYPAAGLYPAGYTVDYPAAAPYQAAYSGDYRYSLAPAH